MREVIAMVKQIGIPTWLTTLSCVHLRLPELFQILAGIQGNDLTDKQVNTLSCNERCPMLNIYPVVVAKHTRKELKHSSLKCFSNAKLTGKIVLRWAVVPCMTKTLDMKPE